MALEVLPKYMGHDILVSRADPPEVEHKGEVEDPGRKTPKRFELAL